MKAIISEKQRNGSGYVVSFMEEGDPVGQVFSEAVVSDVEIETINPRTGCAERFSVKETDDLNRILTKVATGLRDLASMWPTNGGE